jgi:hypothetical protein
MTQKAEGQLWIKLREMFMDEAEKFKAHQSHTMCSAHADQFGRDALDAILASGFRYVGPDEVVVPREPTEAMQRAGIEETPMWLVDSAREKDGSETKQLAFPHRDRRSLSTCECAKIYRAMIEASEKEKK